MDDGNRLLQGEGNLPISEFLFLQGATFYSSRKLYRKCQFKMDDITVSPHLILASRFRMPRNGLVIFQETVDLILAISPSAINSCCWSISA
jgi:hypothetical protein